MLRTVADDTPSPAALTRRDDGTGSPDEMYSRTSAANTRFERLSVSISTLALRLLRHYTTWDCRVQGLTAEGVFSSSRHVPGCGPQAAVSLHQRSSALWQGDVSASPRMASISWTARPRRGPSLFRV